MHCSEPTPICSSNNCKERCASHSGCTSESPICILGECKKCSADSECIDALGASFLYCHNEICGNCRGNHDDCPANAEICSTGDNKCKSCTSDTDCLNAFG